MQFSDESYVLAIFLDLAKAFDTADHNILFSKMERAGIRGAVRSYLLNRQQFIYVDGNSSSLKDTLCGVPQGSVLGLLLFLIYINDIGMLGLNCAPNLFADDTLLYYANKDPLINAIRGQDDLDKLTLNVGKTNFMNILSKRKASPVIHLNNDGILIDEVSEFKYLGIIIDKHLTWRNHISFLCSKLSSRIGILKKLPTFLPKKI